MQKDTFHNSKTNKDNGQSNFEMTPKEAYNSASEYYDDWEWQSFWHENEWPLIVKLLDQLDSPHNILDLGVGTGIYLNNISNIFPHANLFGVDISEGMISRAHSRLGNKVKLFCEDIRSLELGNIYFDLILINRIASHIKNLNDISNVISRFLSPNGVAIISDVSPSHDYVCTRLPGKIDKISVETHKHKIEDWESSLMQSSLATKEIVLIKTNNLIKPETFPREIDSSEVKEIGFVMKVIKNG